MTFKVGDKVRIVNIKCSCKYCRAEYLTVHAVLSYNEYICKLKGEDTRYFHRINLELFKEENETQYEITWV